MIYKIRHWIPVAVAVTAICVLIYLSVQQSYRQTANDPQLQISQDLASLLSDGRDPAPVVPASNIDIADSLATFVIVYDNSGKPIVSSAGLHGQIPVPPAGVFENTKDMRQNRLTWQPVFGVRIAAVLTRYEGPKPGYVLAGRSLREAERRIQMLGRQVGFLWLAALFTSLVATIIFYPSPKREREKILP